MTRMDAEEMGKNKIIIKNIKRLELQGNRQKQKTKGKENEKLPTKEDRGHTPPPTTGH